MSAAERLLALAAALLPAQRRQARLEEWRADLHGASELGIPGSSIVIGAWRFALTVGLGQRLAAVRPRTVLLGALVVLAVAIIAVPVIGVAGLMVAQARGIVTVETAEDGSELTVHWREYPGVAGVDPAEVLAGPSLEEGQRLGAQLVAEIREALSTEFGLEWAADPNGDHQSIRISNRYGGPSLLSVINDPVLQSTSVPRDWTGKQHALDLITEVAARHGFTELRFDHEEPTLSAAERLEYFGGATPDAMVELTGWIAGPHGQWLAFGIRDLRNDSDGRFAERLHSALEHGWQPESVHVQYGANALLAEADRAEFERRLAPFTGYEQPEPSISD